jgi:Flp pilus assembly protein TadG
MSVSVTMKTWVRKLIASEAGTGLVEFAIVAPVFAFLLIGLIEIGRFTFFALLAANAARAGVQWGAQNLTTADNNAGMQSAALSDGQSLNWTITPSHFCTVDGTVTPCASGVAVPAGQVYYVEVDTTGTFTSLLKYPGIPQSLPVSGKAVMRVVSQ